MTRRLLRFLLVASFFTILLLLYGSTALAADTPIQVSSGFTSQGRPDVHDNTIVWKRLGAGGFDIYSFNTITGTEQVVDNTTSEKNMPSTNGGTVFWMDGRNGNFDIYMRDLFLGITQPLVSGPGNQGLPAVSGNIVVYSNDVNGNDDVYAIDLTTRAIQAVSTDPAKQWQPRISGTRVVWQDNRNGHYDIYMKDLSTGVEQQVTSSPGDDKTPDIGGNLVVWQRTVGNVSDIWMKDLATGIEQQVTNDVAYQNSPRVSGDLIVWEDYRSGNYDLYVKDLSSGIESPLATGPTSQARASIDRDKVVWEEYGADGRFTVWLESMPDTIGPKITGQLPENGTDTNCGSPLIAAGFSDNRMGVDAASVQLLVDGEDVTSASSVTDNSVSYQPGTMGNGQHSISLNVADNSGNVATSNWVISTSSPAFSFSAQRAYWSSYSDFVSEYLTVPFDITNASEASIVYDVKVLAAYASDGVTAANLEPINLGDVEPGVKADFVLKYLVPQNTSAFKTSLYVSARDACNKMYYFPGPPPA